MRELLRADKEMDTAGEQETGDDKQNAETGESQITEETEETHYRYKTGSVQYQHRNENLTEGEYRQLKY